MIQFVSLPKIVTLFKISSSRKRAALLRLRDLIDRAACISLYTAVSEVGVLLLRLSVCDGLGASIANWAEVDESKVTNAYGLNALRLLPALSLAWPTIVTSLIEPNFDNVDRIACSVQVCDMPATNTRAFDVSSSFVLVDVFDVWVVTIDCVAKIDQRGINCSTIQLFCVVGVVVIII